MNRHPFLLTLIVALCGGTIPIVGKIALEAFHPFTATALRFVFACLVLLPFVYAHGELSLARLLQVKWAALFGALNPIILFLVLPFIPASVTPFIFATVPLMTALYMYAKGGELLTRVQVFGIVIGLVGVAVVVVLPVLKTGASLQELAGNILLLGAAAMVALYGIASKKHQKEGISPLSLTFYFCLTALLISTPIAGAELIIYGLPVFAGYTHLASVIFAGVIGTGLFYWIYQRVLKSGTATTAVLYTYLQPVVTVSLATLFLKEVLTMQFILGGALAVTGAWLASIKEFPFKNNL